MLPDLQQEGKTQVKTVSDTVCISVRIFFFLLYFSWFPPAQFLSFHFSPHTFSEPLSFTFELFCRVGCFIKFFEVLTVFLNIFPKSSSTACLSCSFYSFFLKCFCIVSLTQLLKLLLIFHFYLGPFVGDVCVWVSMGHVRGRKEPELYSQLEEIPLWHRAVCESTFLSHFLTLSPPESALHSCW